MKMTNNLRHIPIDWLIPSRTPMRPVRKTDQEFIEFMESIRTDGILQPLLVRPCKGEDDMGKYEVVEGTHRYEAAKLVGLKSLPCMIRDITDEEVLVLQLKAQAVRPTKTKIYEYSRRLRKLNKEGYTIGDLAALVDKHPSWIQQMLSLHRLTPKCVHELTQGNLTVSSAIELAKLPEHLQETFLDDAAKMKTVPFKKRVREIKRDYDSFLLQQRENDLEQGLSPKLRGVKDIIWESETFEAAKQVLTSCNANTPEMGWKACLAWIMRIDPVSVKKRKANIKDTKNVFLTQYQVRQKQRELIKNLTFKTNETGETNE